MKYGFDLLHDKVLNQSITFSRSERQKFRLQGLLPYAVISHDELMKRFLESLNRMPDDIDRYMALSTLQERNEHLFYYTILRNIPEMLPLIYTPTVGEACRQFSHIAREPKGFFITPEDKGNIYKILGNWLQKDVKIIVITDGQRILGLGDLGANGMGIPIGKLALYSACAGIPPKNCLPVMLDVGTNNEALLNDVLYLGYPKKRISGTKYFELVDEFVKAVQKRYPGALIQFEDFLTPNAYSLLNKYREKILCFNDDIQGTAAVALAGVLASTRLTKKKFKNLKILFLGAGSAATGIADLMVKAFMKEGLTEAEACSHLWFADINGLVVKSRKDLMPHNLPYAHNYPEMKFEGALKSLKPDVLIGATGAPGTFTKSVIETMCRLNERPVIFALSNPTSKAECTATDAYTWSKGKAIFTSGSPFADFKLNGKTFRTGQGNNAYVFPGIGLGAIFSKSKIIPDDFFLSAAETLAGMVSKTDLNKGALYPPLQEIRKISLEIAYNVALKSYELKLAGNRKSANLKAEIEKSMYKPWIHF